MDIARFRIGDRVRKIPSVANPAPVGIVLSVWPHHKEIKRFYYEVQFERVAMYHEAQLEPAASDPSESDTVNRFDGHMNEDLVRTGHSPPK